MKEKVDDEAREIGTNEFGLTHRANFGAVQCRTVQYFRLAQTPENKHVFLLNRISLTSEKCSFNNLRAGKIAIPG